MLMLNKIRRKKEKRRNEAKWNHWLNAHAICAKHLNTFQCQLWYKNCPRPSIYFILNIYKTIFFTKGAPKNTRFRLVFDLHTVLSFQGLWLFSNWIKSIWMISSFFLEKGSKIRWKEHQMETITQDDFFYVKEKEWTDWNEFLFLVTQKMLIISK